MENFGRYSGLTERSHFGPEGRVSYFQTDR